MKTSSSAPALLRAAALCLTVGASISPLQSAPKAPSPEEFRVLDFTPTGQAQPNESVTVTFSTDLPTQTLGTTSSASAILAFDPSVSGTYRFESARKVRFTPHPALRRATPYVVRVNPRLRDASGRRLSGGNEFEFATPPLALENVEQRGFTPDRRAILELNFSDEVQPDDLHKHLFLSSGGEPLEWVAESSVRSASPRVVTDPLSTESLSLRLEPGLSGDDGPLPLDRPIDQTVSLSFRLTARELTARWDQEKPSLVLKFSSGIDLASAAEKISVFPAVPFHLEEDGYGELMLVGDFVPQTRYTVTVREGLTGSNGTLLLKDAVLSTWLPQMKPFLEMRQAGGHLSTRGGMKLRVRSAGFRSFTVSASRVYDNNLAMYAARRPDSYEFDSYAHEVARRSIVVHGAPASPRTTEVDLREVLGADAAGLYRIEVEGQRPEGADPDDYRGRYHRYRWQEPGRDSAMISLSNLGLVAKRSPTELVVWAAELDTAAPREGVRVQAYSAKNQLLDEGLTNASGAVVLKNVEEKGERLPAVVLASVGQGGEMCYLDLRQSLAGAEEMQTSGRRWLGEGYEAFLTPERGAYRPGETVHLLGYIRGRDLAVPPASFPVELVLVRPDGKALEPRLITPARAGSFTTEISMAPYAPTGLYQARLQLVGAGQPPDFTAGGGDEGESAGDSGAPAQGSAVLGETQFYVEEFLPNRLKVTAEADDRRFSTSEPLTVLVRAEEMFGQPAAGRDVEAVATFWAEPFAPEGFKDYTFGNSEANFSRTEFQVGEESVSADGRTSFTVDLPELLPPAALRATVQTTVKENGGRGVTDVVERVVDPVPYYIGVKTAGESFPQPGQEERFEVVAVRPGGGLVEQDTLLTATVSRVMWNSVLKREDDDSHRWVTSRELQPVHSATVNLSGGRGALPFTAPAVGAYQIKLADTGTSAVTTYNFYASASRWEEQPWSLEKPERLELVFDRERYVPGERARVIVKSPFAGTLLLTQEQDRVLSTTVVQMTQNTVELEVPVEEAHLPNFYLAATVLRPVRPTDKWMPHRAFGVGGVRVESDARRLGLRFEAPVEVRPGARLEIPVTVADAVSSSPVAGAEITLWAVDEGILTLTDFKTPDPLDWFLAPRRLMVETADFLSDLMPELLEPAGEKSAPGGGDEGAGRMSPVPAERVRPVALWLGTRLTGPDGLTTATFELPQFFGRLRVMGVAAEGKRFGSGETPVYVRGPVMVKENLPRFVSPGDQIFPSLVVYNNSDHPVTATLQLAASGPLEMVESGRWKKNGTAGTDGVSTGALFLEEEIPARGQVTRVAEMRAPLRSGVAMTTFSATVGGESFSGSVEIPVRPASPRIRLTGRETIASGTRREIGIPGGDRWLPGSTTATLVVSGLPVVHLAGGLDYLVRYPYGCAEQTVSGAFPLLYLPELASQVDPGRFSRDGIIAAVQHGIDRVLMMQTPSGGIAVWPGHSDPDPWVSIYTAHFLLEARKAGYQVPEPFLGALLSYVGSQLSGGGEHANPYDLTARSYGCFVLALGERRDLERMEALYEKREQLPAEGRALLASAYALAGQPAQSRELLRTTALPSLDAPRLTGGILFSPVRETSILLASYLDTDPKAPEIPGLVQRLESVAEGQRGHWGSTQDNSFALFALGRYARHAAQADENVAGTVTLASGEKREFSTSAPLTLMAGIAGTTLTLTCTGEGAAYAYWRAEGVPLQRDAAPTTVTRGLEVHRRFLDRAGKPLSPRRIPQGKLVVVEIEIPGTQVLDNVVIEDLLPAGFEIENASFETSEQIDGPENTGVIVDRTEARDDRMVAFVNLRRTPKARRVFRYAVRAVTPGTFALPPVQVSCMYDPDIETRGGAGVVSIEPKRF